LSFFISLVPTVETVGYGFYVLLFSGITASPTVSTVGEENGAFLSFRIPTVETVGYGF
jgi:hypothetical protein